MSDITFFEQLLVILVVSLIIAILFRRLQLPAIVAYIVVGCLLGPQTTGLVADIERFSFIAEFGLAFLLFSLGLEFSLSRMMALKSVVFGLGFTQVLGCTFIFTLAVFLWGGMLESAIAIGAALSLSSTAIVIHELSNLQQMNARYAQLAVGVLLFQDLMAVLFLILVPVLGNQGADNFGWLLFFSMTKGLLLFVFLMATGKWVLPKIYHEIARSHSDAIFVLSTLSIALLAAWLTHMVGLSMTLGSFVIGMMLSESSFKHQIINDIRPFKDILLGLFFVSIGLGLDLSLLYDYWFRIIYMALGLIAIKIFIIAIMVRITGDSTDTAIRTSISLAQAGEFGLALVTLAYISGVLPIEQASFIIMVAVFTMLLSPTLIRNTRYITHTILSRLLSGTKGYDQTPNIILHSSDHVIIGGFGRVGQTVADVLIKNDLPYIGIDLDIDLISEQNGNGKNVVYGDCTRLDILESCHIANARLAILTFKSVDKARSAIHQIRSRKIDVPIIVRCYEHGDFEELVSIGADRVIPEMLEASLIISTQVLTLLNIEKDIIDHQIEDIRQNILGKL